MPTPEAELDASLLLSEEDLLVSDPTNLEQISLSKGYRRIGGAILIVGAVAEFEVLVPLALLAATELYLRYPPHQMVRDVKDGHPERAGEYLGKIAHGLWEGSLLTDIVLSKIGAVGAAGYFIARKLSLGKVS